MEHHILVKKNGLWQAGGRDCAGRDGQTFQRVQIANRGVEPNHARGLDGEVVRHLGCVGVSVQITRWQTGAAGIADDDGAVISAPHH